MAGPWTGDVEFTINDGQSTIVAPSNTVQAVIGPAISGTIGQVVVSADNTELRETFSGGPLLEAAGLVVQTGGTVLAVRATTATAGAINGTTTLGNITDATNANPIVITVTSTAAITSGSVVTIASVGGNTAANGTWPVTVINATTFSIPVAGSGAYTSGGTAVPTGAYADMAGTAVPYFTGTPNDTYYPRVVCQTGFTVGTTGGSILISLDAGRTYGPPIAVGTATTIALADSGGLDTGLTLNLGGSTKTWTGGGVVNGVPVGDYVQCSTTEPQMNASGVGAALQALVNYLNASPGVFPIVSLTGTWDSSLVAVLQSSGSMNLNDMATDQYLFARGIVGARDVSPPLSWGGTGETQATWKAAVLADFASTTANRVSVSAGWYNMPSAFPTLFASVPQYRRPLSSALAAREASIPTQTHAGKVGGDFGGPLSQIVVSPTRDPYDGFVYHNELTSPGFDYLHPGGTGRITAARTHARKAGFYISNPLLLAANGSDFSLLPRGLVMDVACTVAYNVLVNFIAADLLTKPNGTLTDTAAGTIAGAVLNAIDNAMTSVGMISDRTVVVDQTNNVLTTQVINVTITILGVAYVLQINTTTGFATDLTAATTGA